MPKINNRSVRELRRKQAEERQTKYDTLSSTEKVEMLVSRPGGSARERARIASKI